MAPREEVAALGSRLPASLRLGTSSWSFPGWSGLVYDRTASEQALARDGLRAYARHPLFRSVGVDKTYYRPAPRAEFERLAAQVPAEFRFLVKMWRGVVEQAPPGPASAFLDARVAEAECVRPAIEGLGEKAGPLLFQFPPMNLAAARDARRFLESLGAMLRALPRPPSPKTSAGRPKRSTKREATMPTTPGCQRSSPTTTTRAVRNAGLCST